MGLDMFAYKVPKKFAKGPLEVDDEFFNEVFDNKLNGGDSDYEIMYWRKHPNLHGWMENLYRSKGGTEEFNGDVVELTLADLADLEEAVKNDALPETSGFFFGTSYRDDAERKRDLGFIETAREAIKEGFAVYYDSSW